ncbi:MAG TPA: alpha/beta hydrolase [Humisphaera sp.]
MLRSLVVVALALLLAASTAQAQSIGPVGRNMNPPVPEGVEFVRDVVYGRAGDTDLLLNLARPKAATGKLPCLVVLHGGGWANGNRNQHNDLVVDAAKRGYVAVTVEYRLAPKDLFPAQVHDVKAAVRFLRASADKYGIDPDRIGAVGFSAGGHLAMMLGTTEKADDLEGDGGNPDRSSKVQAVVSFFGPTDLAAAELRPDVSTILRNFLGATLEQKPELYKRASPITYVRPTTAPMLLYQGTIDALVNYRQAVRMAEALTKAEVDGRVELLIGVGHGWGQPNLKHTIDGTYAFFGEKLNHREGRPTARP